MLTIMLEETEFYDPEQEMFFYTKPVQVRMEHSLISMAKWEALWEKSYLPSPLSKGISGRFEEISYLECMLIGNYPEYIPQQLYLQHYDKIRRYLESPQSATTIHRIGEGPKQTSTVTAELIYYWMIRFGIPLEMERWHLNRLLTLIDVCNVKENSSSKGKMSPVESANHRHQLNKARRGLA